MIEGICICTLSEFFLISRRCPVTNASKHSKATTEWKIPTSIPCPGCKEGSRTKAPNLNAPARQLHGKGQIQREKQTSQPLLTKCPALSNSGSWLKMRETQFPYQQTEEVMLFPSTGHSSTPYRVPAQAFTWHQSNQAEETEQGFRFSPKRKKPSWRSLLLERKRSFPAFLSAAASRSVQVYFKTTPKRWLLNSWRLHTRILTACGFQLWDRENCRIK